MQTACDSCKALIVALHRKREATLREIRRARKQLKEIEDQDDVHIDLIETSVKSQETREDAGIVIYEALPEHLSGTGESDDLVARYRRDLWDYVEAVNDQKFSCSDCHLH